MSRHNSALYATQTGMVVNSAHAYPKIPGVDVLFPPFNVARYQDLRAALGKRKVDPTTKLMVFAVGQQTLALVLQQMAFHHVAQGQMDGQAWAP
jgi:hypothetical protein